MSTKAKLAEEMLTVGDVLVRARERARLKQGDVARRLGLPPSYLSKIENGTRRLDVVEFIRLAEAIEIDAAELVRELQQELTARSSPH